MEYNILQGNLPHFEGAFYPDPWVKRPLLLKKTISCQFVVNGSNETNPLLYILYGCRVILHIYLCMNWCNLHHKCISCLRGAYCPTLPYNVARWPVYPMHDGIGGAYGHLGVSCTILFSVV